MTAYIVLTVSYTRTFTLQGEGTVCSKSPDMDLSSVCVEIGYILSFIYFFVGWHANAVSLPPGDIILAKLTSHLNDFILMFTFGITNLSLYKHWVEHHLKAKS
jgi:hypothetical protein